MEDKVVSWIDGENGLTQKIQTALFDAARQFVYIGFLLAEADRLKHYEEKGYSSIYEYAEVELNFKRTSTKNFIAVAETFGNGSMNLQTEFSQYGYSQLTEMLSMSPTQRKDVNPDMTVKQIRQMKQQAAEELKADNYTIAEVVEAPATLVTEQEQEQEKAEPQEIRSQTSDQWPRWIPVTERQPEEIDNYIVTIKWVKESKRKKFETFTGNSVYMSKESGWATKGVIAWMECPKPYEE